MRHGATVAALALLAGACSTNGTLLAPMLSGRSDEPVEPCVAAHVGGDKTQLFRPDPARVFMPQDRGRCSVDRMTLAVRNEGRLRGVYGEPDAPVEEAAAFDSVIEYLRARRRETGAPLRILIYAHGGMVSHKEAVRDDERLAPAMMADGYTPLFLVWNSDFPTAYYNRLCCVLDGRESNIASAFFAPTRIFGDVVDGVARAPETWGKQVVRFTDSVVHQNDDDYYLLENDPWRTDRTEVGGACAGALDPRDGFYNEADTAAFAYTRALGDARPDVVYPPFCDVKALNDRTLRFGWNQVGYVGFFPLRFFSNIGQGPGASAWDNMVRRTRLAFAAPATFEAAMLQHAAAVNHDCVELSQRGAISVSGNTPDSGAFSRFFARLQCEIDADVTRDDDDKLWEGAEVHFYGHSMGAIVGDELLYQYPDLPYKRIVYMAAASSIRDFRMASAQALAHNDVEFFNLMLHPLAESRELHGAGALPQGSLLEWIDEMFEGPRSFDERMIGKWGNLRVALHLFAPDVRRRMHLRVFPKQSDMPHDAFQAECVAPRGAQRCHPIQHGEFNDYSFWRPRYLYGQAVTAAEIEASEPPPTQPKPALIADGHAAALPGAQTRAN